MPYIFNKFIAYTITLIYSIEGNGKTLHFLTPTTIDLIKSFMFLCQEGLLDS